MASILVVMASHPTCDGLQQNSMFGFQAATHGAVEAGKTNCVFGQSHLNDLSNCLLSTVLGR